MRMMGRRLGSSVHVSSLRLKPAATRYVAHSSLSDICCFDMIWIDLIFIFLKRGWMKQQEWKPYSYSFNRSTRSNSSCYKHHPCFFLKISNHLRPQMPRTTPRPPPLPGDLEPGSEFWSKIFWFSQRCSMTHHVPLIDLKFKVSYNLYTVYTSTCTEGFLIHCCILLHCRYRYHWTAMKLYGGTRVPVTSPRQKAISRLVSATNTLGSWLRRLISSPKDWNLLRPQDFRYMQQAPSCKICWVCWFNVKTNRLVDGYWLTFKVNV